MQVKEGSHPYQMPPRRVACVLQKPLKEDLEWLQKQQIIVPLGVDEKSEGHNSFVLVPKANGKFRLCLDPVQLNKVLIRPIHRGPTLKDIMPKPTGVKFPMLIDSSSGYYNEKHNDKTSYLTIFAYPIGRYQYERLPFGDETAHDMFQKIDKLYQTE